jgi:hypothetical protein
MGLAGSFTMRNLGMTSWSPGTVQVFVYTYTGTLPSNTLNTAQMTLVGQSNVTAVGAMSHSIIPLLVPPVIPAGSKMCVEQRQLSGGPWCIASNYGGNSQPGYMNCIGSIFGFPAIPTSYATLGYGYMMPVQVLNGLVVTPGPGLVVQTSGLPTGSTFPIGTTTQCFNLVNPVTGAVADDCCFDITVNEFANPTHTLACNDLVQISLDETCTAVVGADFILEGGPYGCYDNYIVEIQIGGIWVPAILGPQHIGQTIVTRVTDPETGNSCWGTIHVEDKIPPVIECRDVTIMCGEQLPNVPAPEIVGYQNILITGLNDLG